MECAHDVPRGEIPPRGPRQSSTSRTANYDAAKRAARLAGLRHCVALLDLLGGLHVAVAPEAAAVHPSQAWLADQLGCAVSTVRAQLDALADAGILARARSKPTPTGPKARWRRRTNRYWLTMRTVWARIRAGRTYRRPTGAVSPHRGAESLGGPDLTPPPPPQAAPQRLFDPPEPYQPPDEAERGRVKAALAALRGPRRRIV